MNEEELKAALVWNQNANTRLTEENALLRHRLALLQDREILPVPHEDIGRGTYWAPDVVFQRYRADERVKIGNFCSIARGVTISTGGGHNYQLVSTYPFDAPRTYLTSSDTTIGNDVWICEGSYVGGGAVVGDGCVIGANSVLSGKVMIPDFAIVVGNPGEVKGYRFKQPIAHALKRIAWWNWSDDLIEERKEWFYKPVEEFVEHFGSEY